MDEPPRSCGDVLATLDACVTELGADPFGCAEGELEVRLVEVASAMARLEAAYASAVAGFDATQGWAADGSRSAVSWLRTHAVWSDEEARRRVRLAEGLRRCTGVARALGAGQVSVGAAEVLCAAARTAPEQWPDVEDAFLGFADGASLRDLRAFCAVWTDQVRPPKDPADEDGKWASRRLHLSDGVDGRLHGAFSADPTDAGVIRATLHHYEQILHRSEDSPDSARTPAQRRIDALVLMMRDVQANLIGVGHAPASDTPTDDTPTSGPTTDERTNDGPMTAAKSKKTRPLRAPDVTITIPHWLTRSDNTAVALFGGLPVAISGDLARHLTCSGSVTPLCCGEDGQPLHLGRCARLASPAQRRALVARDGGCAFPECGMPPQFCDAHHITHWDFDGPTDLGNLLLACGHHHRMLHKSRWKAWIDPDTGLPRFRKVPPAEPAPHGADPHDRCCNRRHTTGRCDHDHHTGSTRHRARQRMTETLRSRAGPTRAGP